MPIAGDDPAANATVAGFLDSIGYDSVDAGPLAESWRFQPDTPVYGVPYAAPSDDFFTAAPAPAPASRIAEALAAARR